jgi:hypothetical protein
MFRNAGFAMPGSQCRFCIPVSHARTSPRVSCAHTIMKKPEMQNEEATRQQGSLFFKGE